MSDLIDWFLQGVDPDHRAIADEILDERLTGALHQIGARGLPPDAGPGHHRGGAR